MPGTAVADETVERRLKGRNEDPTGLTGTSFSNLILYMIVLHQMCRRFEALTNVAQAWMDFLERENEQLRYELPTAYDVSF